MARHYERKILRRSIRGGKRRARLEVVENVVAVVVVVAVVAGVARVAAVAGVVAVAGVDVVVVVECNCGAVIKVHIGLQANRNVLVSFYFEFK